MNRYTFFTEQLSHWLFDVDWYFVTLLGITIDCVDDLPDDCDSLINELLLQHPVKPSQAAIADSLLASERLSCWFAPGVIAPKVTRVNLAVLRGATTTVDRRPVFDTVSDLADWLAVTPQELRWLANLWRFDITAPEKLQHYRYRILEKRDGRLRLIEQPKTRLKRIQRKINAELLSTLGTHPAAHGFSRDRSCHSHASLHVGKQYLLLFDIAECFQSITWPRVKTVFKGMGYPETVCVYLTALCTHSVRLQRSEKHVFGAARHERLRQRHLPQGAPGSPALANAVLRRLDKRLAGLADRFDLAYSRYADDIALSGDRHRDWRFLQPVVGRICLEEGVSLNYRKTRMLKQHQKQRVTGIVVNSKTNIDRQYFDNLKATLTNCTRFGLESQNHADHPHFRAHLLGKIQYVKSLNEKKGLKLERLYRNIVA